MPATSLSPFTLSASCRPLSKKLPDTALPEGTRVDEVEVRLAAIRHEAHAGFLQDGIAVVVGIDRHRHVRAAREDMQGFRQLDCRASRYLSHVFLRERQRRAVALQLRHVAHETVLRLPGAGHGIAGIKAKAVSASQIKTGAEVVGNRGRGGREVQESARLRAQQLVASSRNDAVPDTFQPSLTA